MTTEVFQKNRYIFSKRRVKKEKLDEKRLVKEVNLLIKELSNYEISLKDLYGDIPSIERKNLILNIAKYASERKEIVDKIKKYKKLPITDIGFETRVKEEFLRKRKSYILAYIILFSNANFSQLVKYLNIEYRELDELSLVPVVDNSNNNLLKGIAIKLIRGKVMIFTDQGEFIRIIDNGTWKKGEESVGKEYLGFKKYKKKILAIAIITITLCFIATYFYNSISRTILIESTSEIKIECNKFNRVVDVYSATEKGKELNEKLNLNNKSIDTALTEVFTYLHKNKMIPQDNLLNVAVTGKALSSNQLEKTSELISEQKIEGEKYKVIINNFGEEITLSAGKKQ